MTTRSNRPRVVLYARASSDAQTHSIEGQLADLHEHCARQELVVVAEVRDQSQKRHTLERPGVDELLDLTAGGGVDEVWAWAWDRFGEFPIPEQLSVMLAADGATLRAMDDAGEGEDAEDLRVIKSLFSRREQRSRARRTRKGVIDKAKRGEIVGSAPQPRYGFVWARDVDGRRVGYEVEPATMENVRRILARLAEGEAVNAIQREFEQSGTPAPGGGPRWSATTIRGIVKGDVYRPHKAPELAGLIAPDVLAGLDPEREYGIAWSGQRRTSFKPGRGKTRVAEWTPPDEWIGIPVDLTASGLERSVVDRARAAIEGNRKPAKLDGYLYELSGGILRCGECGRAMQAYRRKTAAGGYNHYYRCRPSSSLDLCENRRSHRAEVLEHDATNLFERFASRGALLELYDQAVEEQEKRTGLAGNLERRTALTERLGVLTQMRRGYQEQQAEGLMTLAELREHLAELDEEKGQIAATLREIEDASSTARRIQAARDALVSAEWYMYPEYVGPSEWLTLAASPEEIRKAYRKFGAAFTVDAEGALSLKLSLDLEEAEKSLQEKSIFWAAAIP